MPPSTNALWRLIRNRSRRRGGGSHVVRSRAYEEWLQVAVPLLRFGLARPPLPARIQIIIRGGEGWNNRRDLDNTIKATVDAIVHARLIPDDTTRYVHEVRCLYVPALPGLAAACVVSFTERGDCGSATARIT